MTEGRPALPEELAPSLRAAAERLLAECGAATPREPDGPKGRRRTRCWHCGKPGRMGGHHLADGTVVYVHRSCHRALHRRPEFAAVCTD